MTTTHKFPPQSEERVREEERGEEEGVSPPPSKRINRDESESPTPMPMAAPSAAPSPRHQGPRAPPQPTYVTEASSAAHSVTHACVGWGSPYGHHG